MEENEYFKRANFFPGLKADVEDFGPKADAAVHHLESDWDFLLERAKRYGRSVYEWEGTVYIKNEVTVSREDIVLEFGKSIVSFRARESLAAQISKCTYTGWNMTKCEGVTGSATLDEIPVKVGGNRTWADEARILPGKWESVVDSQGVKDAEEARNRALGELQNASMEWQRAEVRCEGLCQAHPGMRATLKYVGERFSGEYVIERVNHEFDMNGFITELHLRRNMLPGEPKRTSAIDEERGKDMRRQVRSLNAGSQSKAETSVTMFHVRKNMDGAEFVSSAEKTIFVDTSGGMETKNSFLANSEEGTTDNLENTDGRIEGYYYFIQYMNDFGKNETRYSTSLRNLNADWLETRKKLSKSYSLKENRNSPYSKLLSLTIYNGRFPIGVLSVMYKGYSIKVHSISSAVESARGIHVFQYVGEV